MDFKIINRKNLLTVGASTLLSIGILSACSDDDVDIDNDPILDDPTEDITPGDNDSDIDIDLDTDTDTDENDDNVDDTEEDPKD